MRFLLFLAAVAVAGYLAISYAARIGEADRLERDHPEVDCQVVRSLFWFEVACTPEEVEP